MAAQRGWRVAAVYTDNDISAYSGKPRPQYRRLLADIESGAVQAVVVWHLDRLHRQPKELEVFIDLVERHGVALASVAGEHDLGTPEGRLHARILGAVARMESEHKSRRIRRKKLEMARAGKPAGGGYRAFGYSKDGLTVVPDEAAVIQEAASRLLHGDSLRSIVLDLNARRMSTTTGGQWIARSMKRVLLSPRTAGLIEHHDAGTIKASWPPIIAEGQRARLTALLGDPRRRATPGRPARYLLSGVLRCGECGGRLVSVNARNSRGRAYGCPPPPAGCNHTLIVAGWAEDFVAASVLEALRQPQLVSGGCGDSDHEQDLEALASDRAQLEELAAAYAARQISMAEWLTARTAIERRIASVTQRVADHTSRDALRRMVSDGVALADQWSSLPLERQRSVLGNLLDHIVVNRVGRGRYADPSRLRPVWRS